jgi:hypothetical protein
MGENRRDICLIRGQTTLASSVFANVGVIFRSSVNVTEIRVLSGEMEGEEDEACAAY